MTEEEAKAKWCPMAREINHSSNGVVSHNHNTSCIASECAMWKWKMAPKDAAFLNKIGDNKQEPQGYCGLTRG